MVTLTNVGATYDSTTAALGLGLARVDFTGVVQVELMVRVNKIGSGTQSWQLWNETDQEQLHVFDDAGGSGIKTFGPAVINVGLTGVKTIRVRAKSTTSTDDPVYLGAALRLIK